MGAKRKSSWVTLLAIVMAAAAQLASAAQLTAPKEDPPLPDPEVAPRGRTAPRDIKYSQWRKLCFMAPGNDVLCRTTIAGTWDTGQMAIRLDVIEREGSTRIQILLPVGLYLQAECEIAARRQVTRHPPSLLVVFLEPLCCCGSGRQSCYRSARGSSNPVSYTHLTLPTILRV